MHDRTEVYHIQLIFFLTNVPIFILKSWRVIEKQKKTEKHTINEIS